MKLTKFLLLGFIYSNLFLTTDPTFLFITLENKIFLAKEEGVTHRAISLQSIIPDGLQ